jgi:sugar phosphate isomerase/epimerase
MIEKQDIVAERLHRLGIDHPAGWWPVTSQLKAYEAAGFTYVQVRTPPRSVLADAQLTFEHARALRENLALTSLRLVLHAPDDLLAGDPEHDLQLAGAIRYAQVSGAELLVYHGARVPLGRPGVRQRLIDEERSLRRLLRVLDQSTVRLAIENLAPVYDHAEYVSHNPSAVRDLVCRLDSEQVGMCLDVGHAHIVASLAGCSLVELIEQVLGEVIVFHVHDNLGARRGERGSGSIEPVRLDLHLSPGAGTLPWDAVAPLLASHTAPLQLEVHAAQRPAPATLAVLTQEILRPAPVPVVA